MHEKQEGGRLLPLTVYLVQEEAKSIRDMAALEGVAISHYLRQKLKRLLPASVCETSIDENGGAGARPGKEAQAQWLTKSFKGEQRCQMKN